MLRAVAAAAFGELCTTTELRTTASSGPGAKQLPATSPHFCASPCRSQQSICSGSTERCWLQRSLWRRRCLLCVSPRRRRAAAAVAPVSAARPQSCEPSRRRLERRRRFLCVSPQYSLRVAAAWHLGALHERRATSLRATASSGDGAFCACRPCILGELRLLCLLRGQICVPSCHRLERLGCCRF